MIKDNNTTGDLDENLLTSERGLVTYKKDEVHITCEKLEDGSYEFINQNIGIEKATNTSSLSIDIVSEAGKNMTEEGVNELVPGLAEAMIMRHDEGKTTSVNNPSAFLSNKEKTVNVARVLENDQRDLTEDSFSYR